MYLNKRTMKQLDAMVKEMTKERFVLLSLELIAGAKKYTDDSYSELADKIGCQVMDLTEVLDHLLKENLVVEAPLLNDVGKIIQRRLYVDLNQYMEDFADYRAMGTSTFT